MRFIVFVSLLLFLGPIVQAENDYQYLRQDVVIMISLANSDYQQRRGPITEDEATHTVYHVYPPYDPFLTSFIEEQYISVDKASGHALFSKVFRDKDAEDMIGTITSFANPANGGVAFVDFNPKDYTVSPAMIKQSNGEFTDTLRCKGIPVAVLYANAQKSIAVLTIGIIRDADRAAAATKLPVPYEKPWPVTGISDHLSVSGSVISVKGWGTDFDGSYDVAKIANGDSCLSGDCASGHGRKVMASISQTGQPRIRIMDGKFTHNIFTGDGVMLIDGEGPEVAGTYEISRLRINVKMNQYEAKCTFHPKGSTISITGLFYAPYSLNMYDPRPDYKHYTVCEFKSKREEGEEETAWERDVEFPFHQYERDSFKVSASGRAEEARRLANNAEFDAIKQRNAAEAKCTCCSGRGTIVRSSFNHAMGSGVNYMLYQDVICNCCHGTGYASDQTEYKAKRNGGSHLDYKH